MEITKDNSTSNVDITDSWIVINSDENIFRKRQGGIREQNAHNGNKLILEKTDVITVKQELEHASGQPLTESTNDTSDADSDGISIINESDYNGSSDDDDSMKSNSKDISSNLIHNENKTNIEILDAEGNKTYCPFKAKSECLKDQFSESVSQNKTYEFTQEIMTNEEFFENTEDDFLFIKKNISGTCDSSEFIDPTEQPCVQKKLNDNKFLKWRLRNILIFLQLNVLFLTGTVLFASLVPLFISGTGDEIFSYLKHSILGNRHIERDRPEKSDFKDTKLITVHDNINDLQTNIHHKIRETEYVDFDELTDKYKNVEMNMINKKINVNRNRKHSDRQFYSSKKKSLKSKTSNSPKNDWATKQFYNTQQYKMLNNWRKRLVRMEKKLSDWEKRLFKEKKLCSSEVHKSNKKYFNTDRIKSEDYRNGKKMKSGKGHKKLRKGKGRVQGNKISKHDYYKVRTNSTSDSTKDEFSGEWYINLSQSRNEIRRKSELANWWFDRANSRKIKRNKAYWYFQYVSNREDLRHNQKYFFNVQS